MRWNGLFIRATVAVLIAARAMAAQDATAAPTRQSLDDAWWTGPMLANSAGTLPRGHLLVEPYLYDVRTRTAFDDNGARHSVSPSHSYGSLSYIIYGLTDRVALGLIPTFGYNVTPHGGRSSHIGIGDPSLLVQYGLTKFRPGGVMPTTAVAIEETFPTGKYDRLGDRPEDGLGGGAYTTTIELLSQTYFWMPNGRVLRMRFDATHAISGDARVDDASVYGTDAGFHGRASPGQSTFLDWASEYSMTRAWVLALDVTYKHNAATRVTGYDALTALGGTQPVSLSSGASDAFALAPAVEFNRSPNVGVLLGARIIAAGRNTGASITPAIAINIVH